MTEDGVFDEMDDDEITQYVTDYIETYIDDYISEIVRSTDNFVVDIIQSFISEVDWRDIADHYVADIIADVAIRNNVAVKSQPEAA
jgi:adenosine deaminase